MTREEFLGTLAAIEDATEKWFKEARGFMSYVDSDVQTAVDNILLNVRGLQFKFERRYGRYKRVERD